MDRTLYTELYDQLRSWLNTQRTEKADLTLRELAVELGVHHSILGKIENGERKLDIIEYVQVCLALEVDPHDGIDIILDKLKQRPALLRT